ncbi:MAG: DUF7601 domain-containing protein [Coriobacteriales bacterium]|jgi:LPXTG-motif cell wall-anchored protein
MRFNWKKGLIAAVFAGALLAAIPSVAMADTVSYDSTATAFTKVWEAASNQQLNDTESFTFTRTFSEYDGSAYSSSATASEAAKTEKTDITATTTWKTNANGGTSASDTVSYGEVLDGLTFDKPGTYVYSLSENESSNKNVDEDDKTSGNLYVVVNVQWADADNPGGSTVIQSVYTYTTSSDGTETKGAGTFTNTAATNSDVTISNTVKGTAANTSDYFTYTVILRDGTGSYAIEYSDSDTTYTNPTTITAKPDGADESGYVVTIHLKSGQSATIKNLPEGADYTVTQATNDYDTSSFSVSDNDTETADSGSVTKNTSLEATGSVVDDTDDTVAFTNTKGFTAATGITSNTLPFVVLAGLAIIGAIVLVVKRRRRSYEEF